MTGSDHGPHRGHRLHAVKLPDEPLESLIQHRDADVLIAVAADPRLNEELALAFLTRRDLPELALDRLSRNGTAMKHRKVLMTLVQHPRTPRHVSLPISRRLYTFELMQLALLPALAADLKMVIEETIVSRLESVSAGERLTLARRSSTRVTAALLLDAEQRIVAAALDSPYLTETWIVKALMRDDATPHLALLVVKHAKWSLRREVKLALLRNPHTPLARAIAIADSLSPREVRQALDLSRLPANVRAYLEKLVERKTAHGGRAPAEESSS